MQYFWKENKWKIYPNTQLYFDSDESFIKERMNE